MGRVTGRTNVLSLNKRSIAPSTGSAMLCASVREEKVVKDVAIGKSGFELFILDVQVLLGGTAKPIQMRVLRDTGAQHSFIVQLVLPIFVLYCTVFLVPVPRHSVRLQCDMAKGIFLVGVRPELPLTGVAMILVNHICGDWVWPNVTVAPMVASQPAEVASEGSFCRKCSVRRVRSLRARKLLMPQRPQSHLFLYLTHFYLKNPDITTS